MPDGVLQQAHSQAQFTDLAGCNSVLLNNTVGTHGMSRLHYDNGLLALENMIVALSDPSSEHTAVYYMNTVLTRLLKNSFGGTANTLLICCLSPVSLDISGTLHTLQLAVRVRNVKNFLGMKVFNNIICINSPEKEAEEEQTKLAKLNSTDMFGLSFAASQWLKLVASAESLFAELATSATLPAELKDQIHRWLCLKQECEECIESDHGLSDCINEGRSLYRIDELTEPEERNSTVAEVPQSASSDGGSSGMECDSLPDSNIGCPDFSEKLDGYIKFFKEQIDRIVEMTEEKFDVESCSAQDSDFNGESFQENSELDSQCKEGDSELQESDSCQEITPKHLSARRNSICQMASSPNILISELQLDKVSVVKKNEEKEDGIAKDRFDEGAFKSEVPVSQLTDLPNLLKQLKLLTSNSCGKQTKYQQVIIELEESLKGIEEMKACISTKEQLIQNLIKNELRLSLKERLKKNCNKLRSENLTIESHATCADNSLCCVRAHNKSKENIEKYDKEPTKLLQCCEISLKETKELEGTAVDATKTIIEFELYSQVSQLKMQLQKEIKHNLELQNEIALDKEKIKELQEKYCQQEKRMAESNPLNQLHWIQEEETRLMNIQKSALHLHEDTLKQKSVLEKREAFLKEKLCQEKSKPKDEMDVNTRISHLAHVLREQSGHLEITNDKDGTEALRHEIQNLRKTRDCLVEQLCSLDEKFQKEKYLTSTEERKLLECDEAIEAIDAAIEYKNQLICGSNEHGLFDQGKNEKNEELLLARLMNLSIVEIRSLLCKYFKKVIDLRESGRKMDVQLAELDIQADAQTWKIHALSGALQQARVEAKKQIITLQKEHEEKMHVMLRRFAEDSSSGSDVDSGMHHFSKDILTNLSKYKHENKNLRRRIKEMESVIHMSNLAGDESGCPSPVTIPRCNLKQLQGPLAPYTTKVTRQKNKLIIQQHTKKKSNQKS
ncbi:kinesin-like protein costa isoform X2 [Bacillus rossius redtenbacheri]|uniref:kinesin-like protein costa isoform X2 n=1 Tax=Bacillus rossius redtenbacheri TaxID=93214 RepID=UPI002FDCC6DD